MQKHKSTALTSAQKPAATTNSRRGFPNLLNNSSQPRPARTANQKMSRTDFKDAPGDWAEAGKVAGSGIIQSMRPETVPDNLCAASISMEIESFAVSTPASQSSSRPHNEVSSREQQHDSRSPKKGNDKDKSKRGKHQDPDDK
jgi:hypothetical protein